MGVFAMSYLETVTESPDPNAAVKTMPKAVSRTTGKRYRILLIDDHPIVRKGLVEMINREADMDVAGEATDAAEGLMQLAKVKPDLVVTDVSLEAGSGIELIKSVKARYPEIPVLVLSMHDESLYAERALRAGARGYVMKHESTTLLLSAMRRVISGQIHLSDAMATRILGNLMGGAPARQIEGPLQRLSDRELEIFRFIGQGQGVKQIAEQLHLSVKTVETHREHIKEKLGYKTSRELLRFAVQSSMEDAN